MADKIVQKGENKAAQIREQIDASGYDSSRSLEPQFFGSGSGLPFVFSGSNINNLSGDLKNKTNLNNVSDTSQYRIGDYQPDVKSNTGYSVVENSPTDIVKKYVTSNAKPMAELNPLAITAAVIKGGVAKKTGLVSGDNLVQSLGESAVGQILRKSGATGLAYGIYQAGRDIVGALEKIQDEYYSQDFGYELAGKFSKDENGNTIFVKDYEKMKDAGVESGSGVKKELSTENTSVTMNKDNEISINVSPVFASSQNYSDILKMISENYKDITVDDFNKVVDEDTGKTLGGTIESLIKSAEGNYIYNAQMGAQIKENAPTASDAAINAAVDISKIGYYSSDMLAETEIKVYNEANELVDTNAKDFLDGFKNMSKLEKSDYLVSLQNRIVDSSISDDEKAILYAQSQAIYAADSNNGDYENMLLKDFADTIGDIPFMDQRLGDIFGNRELVGFRNNELFSSLLLAGSTFASMRLLSGATNATEALLRKIPGLSSASQLQKVLMDDEKIGKKLLGGAIDVGFQLGADAVYELGKMGVWTAAGNGEDFDYLNELTSDLYFDMLMTYGPSKIVGSYDAPRTEYRVAADLGDGKIEYMRYKDFKKANDEGKNYSLVADENGVRDAKLVEVTAEELSKRRAAFIDKLTGNKAGMKVALVFDRNAAMAKLATQVLKVTGDNFIFRKMLRFSNDIRSVTADVKDDYYSKHDEAKGHLDDFNAKLSEIAPKARKFTKADADYINASANEYRFTRMADNEKEAEAISDYYKPAKEGVTAERAEQLEELMDQMRLVAGDMLDMYAEEGIYTSKQVEKMRSKPEYAGGMFLPVWTKNNRLGSGELSQARTATKNIRDKSQLIDLENLENPLTTLAGYMNNAFRNVALNRRALAIREAASIAGVDIKVVSDTGGALADVTNLKELNKDFRQRCHIIESQVKKKFPDYEGWRAKNEQFVQKSGVYEKISDYSNAKKEVENISKELRNAKSKLNAAIKKLDKSVADKEAVRVEELTNKLKTTKAKQLSSLDDLKAKMAEQVAAATKMSPDKNVSLDVSTYVNVQMTNEIKDALKSPDFESKMQEIFTRAVEYANHFVDPSIIVNRKIEDAAKKFRKELNKKISLSEKAKKEGISVENVINKVMDHIYDDGSNGNKITEIDPDGMTKVLDNWEESGVIRYKIDGEEQRMKLTGFGAEELAREFYEPEQVFSKSNTVQAILNVGNSVAQAKRYLTTSADISRVLPNLIRDWSRGIVSTGGQILLSKEKIFGELVDRYGYDEEQLERINAGYELALESQDRNTFTSSMEMPKKNRAKNMVKAANEPNGNAFVRLIYKAKTGQIGEALSTPQDTAESFTRKRAMDTAYYSELSRAQAKGYSLDESIERAVEAAYFYGREATTNFSRRGNMIAKIAQMVPYLSQNFATIESFKYTWMDNPIKVTRALNDSLLIYTTFIADALMTEESRKKYYLLSEYDRSHNIIIPLGNGAIMTMPLDETIAAFFTPYRRMVESMNGVDPEAFYMCFLEGLSDISPLDFSGFSEGDKFNLKRGLEKLGSQLIPTTLQPIIENILGEDLYYGSSISVDAEYTGTRNDNWTPTPGELTTGSKNSKTLAEVSNRTGVPQWQLQNIVSEYGGNIGQYVLNIIDKAAGATEEAQGGKEWSDSIFKPFTGTDSNDVESKFYDVIEKIKDNKKSVQNRIRTINSKIETATGDELIRLKKEREKAISNYGLNTTDILSRYLSAYEITGGLPKKLANQVWFLFRLYDDNGNATLYEEGSTGDYYTDKASSYANKQATNLAAESGADRIISSPVSDYNNTYAEEAFMNTVYGDPIPYISAIEDTLKKNNINRGNMYNGYYAATNSAEKKKWKDDWNTMVVSALAPYVESVGIDTLLNQRKVVDFLDEYIFISNPYKTKDYIKEIFGGK